MGVWTPRPGLCDTLRYSVALLDWSLRLQVAGSVMGLRAHGPLLGPSAAEDAAARRDRAAAAAEDRAMQQRMAAADAAGFQGWHLLTLSSCVSSRPFALCCS